MEGARGHILSDGCGDEKVRAAAWVEPLDTVGRARHHAGRERRPRWWLVSPGHQGRRPVAGESVVLCSQR